ncbi:MAG: FAD-binding protein [Saprospirales bacterium]|nr:MAG: FAD-binding protein [Saprospirales bacterium]
MNPADFKKITHEDLQFFKLKLGEEYVMHDEESLLSHGRDETEDITMPPEVVLSPENADQVAHILAYCNENKIPVTARGGGTGLSGGAIPVFGGVCLSAKRLNKILEIDEDNFQVVTQPGVITEVLQNAVKEKGLYYPPDPASRGTCFIGGNIAENSGGPRAVKYGVVSDYVLNLEVVLPSGEIIRTGANVLKNTTGYNLTQLIVGSEGTLGFVTEIVLKLLPHPKHDKLLLVPFKDALKAAEAVAEIAKSGISPSALEFMDRDAVFLGLKYANEKFFELEEDDQAHLIAEVDGNDPAQLDLEIEAIYHILQSYPTGEMLYAGTSAEKEKIWKMRRSIGEAVKRESLYKEEDTVVPRFQLPTLLAFVKKLGREYGFRSACYGHAGDGNLHVNILKGDMSDEKWRHELPLAIRELFREVKSLGGTISGEHGIGMVQKDYMDIVFSPVEMELMQSIKRVFDPNGIMNPGKIFPDKIFKPDADRPDPVRM